MRVHDRMLELMESEGIKTLFGIPDPSFVMMFAAAEARGWRVIAPHHEQAGAFMADGLWRMTGVPGVIVGNQGPGVANLAPAAICAAKENTPTIFIAGQRQRKYDQRVRRGSFQYTRQPRFFEEAMKYVGVIEFARQVDEIFHEAFRRALSGTPGPVFIEYPMNVMMEDVSFGPVLEPQAYRRIHREVSERDLSKAVALISGANAPVLLIGQGVFVSRAQATVAELATRLNCPIIQTPGGGAVLPGLFERTLAYSSPTGIKAIQAADLVVALGTEIGEPLHFGSSGHWAIGNEKRKWIYVERDEMAIGVNRPIDVPLVGDLRDVVPQLNEAVGKTARQASESLAAYEKEHAIIIKMLQDSVSHQQTPIHPARFVVEATRALPEDSVIVRDGGALSIFTATYSVLHPKDLIWCQNFGHLGTGLPHAIGAQLAVGNNRRVVLISGDSAFLFHISELETAVRKNLPVVCIVGCDYAWGLEVATYKALLGDKSPETEAHWGKQLRLDKIAEGFGAYGEYVDTISEIAPAVQRALASRKPAVIQVPIDARANANEIPNFAEFASWYGSEAY